MESLEERWTRVGGSRTPNNNVVGEVVAGGGVVGGGAAAVGQAPTLVSAAAAAAAAAATITAQQQPSPGVAAALVRKGRRHLSATFCLAGDTMEGIIQCLVFLKAFSVRYITFISFLNLFW